MISIIGAGTAGLIAARRLGQQGLGATVYDQKSEQAEPERRASGILSIRGLKGLGIDYSGCITNTLYGANIHCGGKTMSIRSGRAVANVVDRKMLNDACLAEAQSAGAEVKRGMRVAGNELGHLSSMGIVVGADGAASSVARHFGLGEISKIVLTYKAEFDVEAPDSRMVDLFFDRDNYRGLFAWLCPNEKDVLEVGVGVASEHGNAKRAYEKFIGNVEVESLIGGKKPLCEGASIIPMSLRKRIVDERRRVVLIGDAAGQVKPTTGGGVIYGGTGAIMAADAISRHIKRGARLSDYETEFRKTYGMDLALHSAINSALCSLSPGMMGRVITALNVLGFDKFLGKYGDMDRPTLILRRFFLRGLAGR